MLDANLTQQLKAYLVNIREPIELVASLGDDAKSQQMRELIDEIAALSDKITTATGDDARRPSFLIRRTGTDIGVRFAGLPMGHEFTSLVLALLQVGGHPSKAAQDLLDQVRGLDGDYRFETYFSLSCANCPDVVQALNLMAVLNPGVTHTAIDGALFQDEVAARKVMAVPTVFLNGEVFGQGRMELEQIVGKLDTGASARVAKTIAAKDPFDVLVIGGGPAGAADHEAGLALVVGGDDGDLVGQRGDLVEQLGHLARLGVVAQARDQLDGLADVDQIGLQLLRQIGVEHGEKLRCKLKRPGAEGVPRAVIRPPVGGEMETGNRYA